MENQAEVLEVAKVPVSTDQHIEILSVELLDQHRTLVEGLKEFTRSVKLELGWHYILDIVWILTHLDGIAGKTMLDAGAGTGVLQWYLAQQGARVISVDRMSRATLPLRFRRRFQVRGWRETDLLPANQVLRSELRAEHESENLVKRLLVQGREVAGYFIAHQASGSIRIYNQDLSDLVDIPTDSVDAVVAVSALEHNSQQGLRTVVKELLRVLKPGGKLLATLVAAKDRDTWHDPSQAWCYTDDSLRDIFELPVGTPSNYEQYDRLFEDLKDCRELRDGLARFYSKSGSSGMPWGKWDPQYQPVGVCKIKTSRQ